MSKLLSDKVKKIPPTEVSADRYEFLKLAEAEPDLGVPSTNDQVLTSTTSGVRSWVNPSALGGLTGATGPQGIQGASGSTGLTGATGIGFAAAVTIEVDTLEEILIDTLDPIEVRSSKYEILLSHENMHSSSEFRVLIDEPNVFLTQYGLLGPHLGSFAAYYSPLDSTYSFPDINSTLISFWDNNTVRIYTTNASVIDSLTTLPIGTIITINDSETLTTASAFTKVADGIFEAFSVELKDPMVLISTISWIGSGLVELRFTGVFTNTTLRYIKETLEI
jgi:hypothetical protein